MTNCKFCNSNNIVKKGIRKLKKGKKQIYLYKNCQHKFALNKNLGNFKNEVIIDVINYYCLGYNSNEVIDILKIKHKITIGNSSIYRWCKDYPYIKIRDDIIKNYGKNLIFSKIFKHSGLLYNFRFHKGKLLQFCKFNNLKKFIFNLEKFIDDKKFNNYLNFAFLFAILIISILFVPSISATTITHSSSTDFTETFNLKEADNINLLVNSKYKVHKDYKNPNIQNSPLSKFSTNSFVVNTLTNDCFLKCRSLDQIAQFNFNANARKSTSFESDNKATAFSRKSSYFDNSKNLIPSSVSSCLNSNSCSDNPDLNKQSLLYLLNSNFINSGAENSALSKKNKYEAVDLGFIIENNMLLSKTSIIFVYFSNLSLFSGDSAFNNFSLTSGDTSESSFLNLPSFTFLPNSTDHLVNSFSSLDSSLSNKFNKVPFLRISSLVNSDQFTQDNSFISDLISSGIANVKDAIYISPLSTICSNFFNCLTLVIIIFLNISDHFISGTASILFFKSSGIDNVIVAILIPPINYVSILKYVDIFKSFVSIFKPKKIIAQLSNLGKNLTLGNGDGKGKQKLKRLLSKKNKKKSNKKRHEKEYYLNEFLAFYLGPAITGFTVLTHTSSTDFTGAFAQETDNINLLVNSENKIYDKIDEKNYKIFKNLDNSSVVNTGTSDCSLKCGSLDQIGILSSNANAKKGTSVLCEINLSALDSEACEDLFNSIIFENEFKYNENASLDIFDFKQIKSEYLFNSSINSLGANNSNLYSLNNLLVDELDLNNENTMLVSTNNSIFYNSYLLDISSLNFLPNSIQSSSVSSEFATSFSSFSSNSSCFILFTNASLANADQFSHSNLSIFCFSSFGTDSVIDTILTSQYDTFNNIYHIYKSFASNLKPQKLLKQLSNLRQNLALEFGNEIGFAGNSKKGLFTGWLGVFLGFNIFLGLGNKSQDARDKKQRKNKKKTNKKRKKKNKEYYWNELLAFLFILFFFVLAFYLGPSITGFTVLTHTSSAGFTGAYNRINKLKYLTKQIKKRGVK